jgi:hypothetical protein
MKHVEGSFCYEDTNFLSHPNPRVGFCTPFTIKIFTDPPTSALSLFQSLLIITHLQNVMMAAAVEKGARAMKSIIDCRRAKLVVPHNFLVLMRDTSKIILLN